MLIITAGGVLIQLEYKEQYDDLVDNARIRSVTEYLISRYEAGMDTREFRRPGPRDRIPRIVIRDMDTGILVYTSHHRSEHLEKDIFWDYVSPSNGRYRIYIEDDAFELDEPEISIPLVWLAFILTAVFSGLLTLLIIRPITKLITHVEGLGEDLSKPLDEKLLARQDELGSLARAVDEMTGRIHALIESKQQLFYNVSHELRAPLARMQVAAEIVRDQAESRGEDSKVYDRVDREIRVLDQLLTELMSYIREDDAPLQTEEVDLLQLVEEVVSDQDFSNSGMSVKMEVDCPEGCSLSTRPVLLARALKNLLENAIKYSPEDSPVEIHVSTMVVGYRICVLDSGTGIPEDKLEEVTQPFTRLHSESIEGVGLGLSIVLRAVEELGGKLELSNREGGGLRACIELPSQT